MKPTRRASTGLFLLSAMTTTLWGAAGALYLFVAIVVGSTGTWSGADAAFTALVAAGAVPVALLVAGLWLRRHDR